MVDLITQDNPTLNFQVSLVRIILTDERLKIHMEIIHQNYKDDGFAMNAMDQMTEKLHNHSKTKK